MASPPKPQILKPSIEVRGDVSKRGVWTLEQIKKLAPIQTVKTTLKGQPFVGRGIPLRVLIEAAQPALDLKSKHCEARFVVLARGSDGYLASFAWPELMGEVGNKSAFIIWEANGQPLDAKSGPLRLMVPGEKKPMRWVYNLVSVAVYDGKWLTGVAR